MKEHVVCLTDEARSSLQELVRAGTRSVRVVRRVQVLLKSDEGLTDEEIAEHVGVTVRTIAKIRKRFCQEGWERAIFDAPRSGKPPVFTVKQQQQVIALACTDPPAGHVRWTLELLRQEAMARGFVSSISTSDGRTVRPSWRLCCWPRSRPRMPPTRTITSEAGLSGTTG